MALTEEQRQELFRLQKQHQDHLKDTYTEEQLQRMGGNTSRSFNCFNPEHLGGPDKGKHMKYISGKQWAHCVKCGESFDLFRMIGIEISSNNFMEQYKAACERWHEDPPKIEQGENNAQEAQKGAERVNTQTNAPNAPTGISGPLGGISEEQAAKQKQMAEAEAAKKAKDLERARKIARDVLTEAKKQMGLYPERAIAYLERRGFSREICDQIGIGYLKDYPKDDLLNYRVIFPTKNGGFIGRSILTEEEDLALDPERKKYKKAWKLGAEVYNIELLTSKDKGPIFVTEGELDAMTIEYLCGLPAIGYAGTGNAGRLINAAKAAREAILADNRALIIIPDNDESGIGQQKAADLLKELRKEGIPALIIESLTERAAGEKKADVNSNYLKDPEGFKASLDKAYAKGAAFALDPEAVLHEEQAAKLLEYDKGTHSNIAEDFRAWAIERAAKPCIPTGFPVLDGLLNGGLREELYILGGIPSSGKTTFALQMADQMTEAGEDVLFFALEQGKYELTSKSISRLTWEEASPKERAEKLPRTNTAVIEALAYKGETEAERKIQGLVNRAMDRYKSFAGRGRIIEAGSDLTPSKIAQAVQLHHDITGNKPVVILDYLQLLGIDNARIIDPKPKIDQAVSDLARLCREKLIPVIAISSLNRDGYEKGGMANLKESGNLEYSAQVVLLLGFRNAKGNKDLDEWIDDESLKNPREVYLKISKHKNAEKGRPVSFEYYTTTNRFKELGIWEKPKKK